MCLPTNVEGTVRNNGWYDPVPYRFWSYPRAARNYYENEGAQLSTGAGHLLTDRCILPRYMCFLDSKSQQPPYGRMTPQEWMGKRDSGSQPTYIFVSYTRENQFESPCEVARQQIKEGRSPNCRYEYL